MHSEVRKKGEGRREGGKERGRGGGGGGAHQLGERGRPKRPGPPLPFQLFLLTNRPLEGKERDISTYSCHYSQSPLQLLSASTECHIHDKIVHILNITVFPSMKTPNTGLID